MSRSEREFERVAATIPVQLEGGGEGETRNLSPNGIFFVTDRDLAVGSSLRFTVEFESTPAVTFYLDCIAEVVRLERADGKVGVGARIVESRLERRTPSLATPPAERNGVSEQASAA